MAGALQAQQQLVLPDNHNLCESTTQLANVGSTSWWRTTAGRFQVIYEASHFLNNGVTGPITITHIRFRGEDAEVNLGGQVYSGVTVTAGSTSLNTTTMSTTFATNRAPVAPDTTTMGLPGTTTVTLAPSVGSVPNNWRIDLDLTALGNTIVYDPTGPEPNLIIDIDMPTAPSNAAPLALLGTQDTTGGLTVVRGRGINTGTVGAATGTNSTAPPVIGIEFTGTGGYAATLPATNEFYGAACGGSPSTFYQSWVNGQAWDLSNGITLTPDSAFQTYTVTAGAPAFDGTKVNATAQSTADDALVTWPLGFTFNYPGGSTTTIKPCTNGFLWLDSVMTATSFAPVVSQLLGNTTATPYTARLAPYWHDLNCGRNLTLNPAAGLHAVTDTSGGPGNAVCYVTWLDIGEFNVVNGTGIAGHTVWNFQVAMYEATGVVEFRYGSMPSVVGSSTATAGNNAAIVGFSRGLIAGVNSVDPQSRDLSAEVPFQTAIEGSTGNIGLTAVATPVAGGAQYAGRLFGGQSVTWNASNIPAGALVGVQLVDVGQTSPGLQLPGLLTPPCVLSVTPGALLWEITFFPPTSVVGTVPLVVPSGYNPGILGARIFSQYVLMDGLFTGGDLIPAASNALQQVVGLN